MSDKKLLVAYIVVVLCLLLGSYLHGESKYKDGYDAGYNEAYSKGYSDGYNDRNKLVQKEIADAVQASTKTETKIVYQTIPYNGNDVQIKTEKPVVTVDINGKQQQVQQHTETADLAVKTETAVKIKVPERRWSIGIGTDGKKAAYMLKFPVKGAVGGWVTAGGKDNRVMGGVSVSF